MTNTPSEQPAIQEGMVPCPTCYQYSHSLGSDTLADAFNHFQSMTAHPVRGHPMGHHFDEKTRDFAQVLMSTVRPSSAGGLVAGNANDATPVIQASAGGAIPAEDDFRHMVRAALIDAWNDICEDTGCHPLDITRDGKKLWFSPRHWTDMAAANLRQKLLALPVEQPGQPNEVERLRAGLQTIADGDEPRPIGKVSRRDDRPSKHDQCVHGVWMYEDCGSCVAAFARAALNPSASAIRSLPVGGQQP